MNSSNHFRMNLLLAQRWANFVQPAGHSFFNFLTISFIILSLPFTVYPQLEHFPGNRFLFINSDGAH